MTSIAIYGLGRIGRQLLRSAVRGDLFFPSVVCDVASAGTLAALLEVDTNYGRWPGVASDDADSISIGGRRIAYVNSRDALPDWKQLGVDEFEPTGTSHVFDHAGTFAIRLTISYAAEYQFGGAGWIPIAGLLAVPSNVIEARAVTAKTVLVAEDCTDNPTGPGC